MPGLGGKRREAGARLVGLIVYMLFIFTVGWLLAIVYFFVAALDILWQSITNKEGFSNGNTAAHLWHWQQRFRGWALFGKNDRPMLREAKPRGGWVRK